MIIIVSVELLSAGTTVVGAVLLRSSTASSIVMFLRILTVQTLSSFESFPGTSLTLEKVSPPNEPLRSAFIPFPFRTTFFSGSQTEFTR